MTDFEFTMTLLGRAGSPGTPQLLSGEVPIAGATAHAERGKDTDEVTAAMLRLKYDVGEMSIGSFTKARDEGIPLKALPIFFGRGFPHRGVFVRPSLGIKQPSDLRGKRVGVRQFWMSAAIWHRLVLHQEYGVALDEMEWVSCQPERLEGMKLPANAKQTHRAEAQNPRDLFLAGDVDAIMVPGGDGPAGSVHLFADPVATQVDYFKRTGVFPTHHIVAIKEDLASREPWLVESLCEAFQRAKEISRENGQTDYADAERFVGEPIVGLGPEDTKKLFGPDPFQYGVAPIRKTLEAFLDDARHQGLTTRSLTVDELFAPGLPPRFR